MRAFRNIAIFLLLLLICGAAVHAPGRLAAQEAQAPSVKAFYLYNLLLFVDWPKDINKNKKRLCVALLGDDPLYHHLQRLSQKTIKGQKLDIRRIQEGGEWPETCRVLFVGTSKKALAPALLKKIGDRPVLTISEAADFIQMGGMIRLKNLGGPASRSFKRFEIHIDRIQAKGMKVRARVLRLADIVHGPMTHGEP